MSPIEILISRAPGEHSPFSYTGGVFEADQSSRYNRLAVLYERGFRAIGRRVTCLDAPSIYQTSEAMRTIGVGKNSAHLSVRPVAAIRPFYGMPNYFVFDGPLHGFDERVTGSLRSVADILTTAARVFCTTEKTTEALLGRGISNAITLPPPLVLDPKSVVRTDHVHKLKARHGPDAGSFSISAIATATRIVGGQLIYCDVGKGPDADTALAVLLDAVEQSGMRSAKSSVVISGVDDAEVSSVMNQNRLDCEGIYFVQSPVCCDDRTALAQAADTLIRLSLDPGLDVESLMAVQSGTLVIKATGSWGFEPIGSSSPVAWLTDSVGCRTRRRSSDLIRSLKEAFAVPANDRRARSKIARDRLQSEHGLDIFANRMRAEIGAS